MNKQELLNELNKYNKHSVFIYGNAGVGKTFLLKQFNRHIYTMLELFNDLQSIINTQEYFDDIKYLKEIDFLILDDFGSTKSSEWRDEVIFEILNYRYENNKKTFISSNLNLGEISEKYDDRIASRIAEKYLIIELTGKDKRLEKKIKIKK